MKEYVRSQNFISIDEIMAAMKDMLKDILLEVMKCELYEELGYEKNERLSEVKMPNKTAEEMTKAIIAALSEFPDEVVKTITCDRGVEFAG